MEIYCFLHLNYTSNLINLSRIADAEENLGESEVREAHLAKSLFYIRIGDKAGSLSTYLSVSHSYNYSELACSTGQISIKLI